ncbi:uncharacterized protein LOC113110572 [Carassius auratus]|uniref:Uncharacterized protein LOC113110572 n=1 Tax=Carassius auratus TaxID=7957 RepID=A0A6P6QAQ5_CARAU|nr:uncharacterized protein LOC113110572 [Carassius auratus]
MLSTCRHCEMALFIFIIFHLVLEDKSQGLPQAKLTIYPTFATDEEKVQMVCGGHENLHISECMFYLVGQEDFLKPSASCNFSLTAAELIIWSHDQESSHVNISCYYTVHALKENGTSPHSDIVSVRVRGLPAMSSLPPTTEGSPTTMTPKGKTYQANLSTVSSTSNTETSLAVTSSTEIITDLVTDTSSLGTHDTHNSINPTDVESSSPLIYKTSTSLESTTLTHTTEHVLALAVTSSTAIITDLVTDTSSLSTHATHSSIDPTDVESSSSLIYKTSTSLESTTLTHTTEHALVFPLMTEGPEIKKYSNKKMLFLIAVVASGGGIVVTGLVGICLYRCTRKSKAERIWMEFVSKTTGYVC